MGENKEVLSFMIYMWNSWSKEEAAIVFNGENNVNEDSWEYSLGDHIWSKWLGICENGVMGAAERLVAELDEDNLNKLVGRACKLYYGRASRK